MNTTVLDIPRIYTGIAEWMACVVFLVGFRPRVKPMRQVAASLGFLVIQCVFLVVTDDIKIYFWIPCMAAAAGLMLLQIVLLCRVSIYTAAYTCVRAFVLAEFAAALQWQIHCFLWPNNDPVWWQRWGLLILIYGSVFVLMGVLEHQTAGGGPELVVTGHELLSAAIIGISVFAVSNLSFYTKQTPFSGQYASEIMNLRTFVDLGGIAILYAYHVQRQRTQSLKELSAMQTMLENQYAQYRMSRDSIDMINRKYHDLKHQIAALRAEPDAVTRNQWLDEMEADIRDYEAQNKTGNSVLDIVLTGKSLYCQKHSIDLSVIADGKILAFIDVMDICTLFGNALDNAIECELKIPDKSKRMIHLTLTTQRQFLMLRVENYCPQPPMFRDGLPVSTKSDPSYHGIGLKSIFYTVKKYGGTATVGMEDKWFVLKALIPLG